ncbi:hypothetical protein PVAND_006688 [Polypedilum vanderplanki]|uniref:Uncharacterized protein n=1 Tax=Polypedilum vanderplanki TaxID=319348 RepID=A0A9J6C3Z0_POLVA|nr:hypothetical protein PVAND_006688 [Polypedilum vanderplanki]
MSDEEILNIFLNAISSRNELQNVLASNAVLEWFGKTFQGRNDIVNFYTGTLHQYQHILTNIEQTLPFENRTTHLSTRKEPEENFIHSMLSSKINDRLHESESSAQNMNVRESFYRTPPQRNNSFIRCPPAPSRKKLLNDSSDSKSDNLNSSDEYDSDDDLEPGIHLLDASAPSIFPFRMKDKDRGDDKIKKPKIEHNELEQITHSISKYSDLNYIESHGEVIKREIPISTTMTPASTPECESRRIKLYISYRVHKENSNDIQIALIVYKSNNTKLRRNLLTDFIVDESEDEGFVTFDSPITNTSQYSTAYKEQSGSLTSSIKKDYISADQSKRASKRPIISRGSIRF